ncbi:MAG: hypothetical protein U0237_06575 [Thermoleophilia bacterium]
MTDLLRRRLTATGHLLAMGAVSWVFSEGMFWAHWREDAGVADLLATWLAYSVVTMLALAAARRFAVSTIAGLFLVGALFGWLVEGAIAGTTFAEFPVGLSWTGLAWHAPLTVCIGWCLLPAVLRRRRPPEVLATVGALGIWLGLWTAGFVHGPDELGAPPVWAVTAYAAGLAAALAIAYPACDRLAAAAHRPPSRLALAVAALATAGWFALAVVPAVPPAAVLLPALLALPLLALRRGRVRPPGTPLLDRVAEPLRARDTLPLALLPVTVAPVYAAAEPFAGIAPVVVVYVLCVPGGVAALVWSMRRVARVGA